MTAQLGYPQPMGAGPRSGAVLILAAVCLAVGAVALWWAAYGFFRTEELTRAQARLSLYQTTAEDELRRFSHLTFVLSQDTVVIETARGGATDVLNQRLSRFADRAGVDAIFLMSLQGITISASNAASPGSFVGQNYSFRPYFRDALEGQRGEFYGIGATTGIPGYFFAEAVKDETGTTIGVIAIKIDLSGLQTSWQQAGERVILANDDGVVLLASRADWLYRALAPLSPDQRGRIAAARQFANQPLEPLDWTIQGDELANIDGQPLLYLSTQTLPNGWTLHYFAPDDVAVSRAWLITVALLLAAGGAVIGWQIWRARQFSTALRRSVHEEAQLRAANERLAREIEDRRSAEQRLQRTQDELQRAGRLAALGQLAASVTHELGQPIAAMRNHLAAAELQNGTTRVTTRLGGLVDRMEGITRQLKFFSRDGQEEFESFDLADAVEAVRDLMVPVLDQSEVDLRLNVPDDKVPLHANRLRVEQVITNLVSNARDATAETEEARVAITWGTDGDGAWLEVCDNGHGLGGQSLDALREPFASSRASGHGMGLGLASTSGIVSDHGGTLTARDCPDRGAVFRVCLPLADGASDLARSGGGT